MIIDEEPSDLEIQNLIKTMDKDGNGKISFDEFLSAMSLWFKDEYKSSGNKKRKLNHNEVCITLITE